MLLYTCISQFSVAPHYQQQLYLRPSLVVFFNFSHKRPTFAFTPESGYTLAFQRKIAHKGTHGETGGVSGGGAITTLGAFCTVRKPCAAGYQNGILCRFWALVEGRSRRMRRACGTAMRSLRVAVPRRRGPAGLRDLFRFCRNCGLYILRSGFLRVRGMGGITTLGVLCVLLKRRTAACKSSYFAVF